MNVETKDRRTKLIICCCIALLAIAIIFYGIGRLVSQRINNYIYGIKDKITAQIGHPITIDKISTAWDFIYLKVRIKNLTIYDALSGTRASESQVPLFMATEIVGTLDAFNSLRTMSVQFKHLLVRSPRLVMQWNGVEPPTVLGLGHENVSGDFNPATLLKLLGQQRRVTIENGDFHLEGKNGADLPFMGVKLDFHKLGNNEYDILARGTVAAAIQPEFVIAAKYHGDLSSFATAMISFEIRTSNIQLAELFNFIPKYRQNLVQGDFTDFNLKGTFTNGTLRTISNEFNFEKIIIAKDTIISGGGGSISFTPGSNNYQVQLQHLTLSNATLFSQPINIDSIATEVVYEETPEATPEEIPAAQRKLSTQNAKIKLLDIELATDINMSLNDTNIESMELSGTLSDASIRKLLPLLPDQKLPLAVTEWLKKSLLAGSIDAAKIRYTPQQLAWSLGFKNTELKFSPLWPSVYDIDAILEMHNGAMKITAAKALILGNELRPVTVNFQPYKDKAYTLLTIAGGVATTLEACMDYIKQTPLQDNIGVKLEPLNPSGNTGLDLQLQINLANAGVPIQFAGTLNLQQDVMQAPDLGLTIDAISGKINFANSSLSSENLKLQLLGQPAAAALVLSDIEPRKLNLMVTTSLNIQAINKILPKLNLDHISGATDIVANIELPWSDATKNKVLNISSDLQGISINYPAPFNKSANDRIPFELLYSFNGRVMDMVRVKLGDLLDGVLYFKNQALQSGRVALNKKLDVVAANDNLQVIGNLKLLDWDAWRPILFATVQNDTLPLLADLNISTLVFHGAQYDALKIKYHSLKKELFVDSPIITGKVAMSQDEEKIDIKLSKLDLNKLIGNKLFGPQQRAKDNALLDYVNAKRSANKLPLLQFYCEDLRVKKIAFKKISLELLPRPYGYEITNFSINNEHLLLQAQGRWQMDNKTITSLIGTAQTQNFGKVLAEWGYRDSVTRGKGEINFAVQWDGAPTDFNLLVLQGTSHMDMRSGNLTQVNPGLGRIIGLLSLESIQRRLQLDFSDLLSRGFAFDKFVADMQLQPGSISSNNILINSPSAKIELFGRTGIKSRELNFTMYVTPKVGAGLPIAAAIAAGPAVGAAIWLFDKASGSRLSEITKYKYRVTGTWDKPQIDEVVEGRPHS